MITYDEFLDFQATSGTNISEFEQNPANDGTKITESWSQDLEE